MAEEATLAAGHNHSGHHFGKSAAAQPETKADKRKETYTMIGIGIAAAGLLVTLLMISNKNQTAASSGQAAAAPTPVNPSTPFIPNPTDVSSGAGAAQFWPEFVPVPVPGKPKSGGGSGGKSSGGTGTGSGGKKKKGGKTATGGTGSGGKTATGGSASGGKIHKQHHQTSNRSSEKITVSPAGHAHQSVSHHTNKQSGG